ncbi:hypothetical protein NDU88_000787 [Pleurodeles waltl]|uniref:Uncharacterized protein n=1 Tax=Pleurodeles waltl TaxID=8319 RepID=A0AAV7SXN5_PLEWA|nr:hypothetical protein NDU88_000787 [Pleurodeles waltl]
MPLRSHHTAAHCPRPSYEGAACAAISIRRDEQSSQDLVAKGWLLGTQDRSKQVSWDAPETANVVNAALGTAHPSASVTHSDPGTLALNPWSDLAGLAILHRLPVPLCYTLALDTWHNPAAQSESRLTPARVTLALPASPQHVAVRLIPPGPAPPHPSF